MTYIRRLFLIIIVFIFVLFTRQVYAACDPAECGGSHGTCEENGWGSEYYCFDKCCVIPPSPTPGGDGGGGGTCDKQTPGSCSSGTCDGGKSCVSTGNPPKACTCSNGPPAWAGYHDSQFGDQTVASCTANGWATDSNNSSTDYIIHIFVDGIDGANEIRPAGGGWFWASDYRSGLEGVCTGGTCAFNVDLSGYISLDVEHNILIRIGRHWLPAYDYSVNPPTLIPVWNRKITCAAPTPTPFPCPANINQSCNGSGTQATISWNPIAAAVGYILRLNHEPYDAPANWYNGAQGDQWHEPVSSTINVAITPGANYQYDVQGKKPGEGSPYK